MPAETKERGFFRVLRFQSGHVITTGPWNGEEIAKLAETTGPTELLGVIESSTEEAPFAVRCPRCNSAGGQKIRIVEDPGIIVTNCAPG